MLTKIDLLMDDRGAATVGPVRYYTRIFLGKSNNLRDQIDDILESPLCPKQGDRDQFNRNAFITDVDVERKVKNKPSYWWLIRVDSTTNVQLDPDPTSLPARVSVEAVDVTRRDYRDIEGKPVVNTAGDLKFYDYDSSNWIINVTKDVKTVPAYLFEFENAINANTFQIKKIPTAIAKEKLRCKGIRISEDITIMINGREFTYCSLTFRLEHNSDGWKIDVPNTGLRQLVEGKVIKRNPRNMNFPLLDENGDLQYVDGKYPDFIKINGVRTTEELPLGPKGRLVADDNGIPLPISENNLKKIKVERYRKLNFNLLPTR